MMKSYTTSCSVLAFALAFSSYAAAPKAGGPALSKPEIERRKESDSIYARQDAILKRADAFFKANRITDAIRLLEEVYYELELEVESVKSWKAESRLTEVRNRLNNIKSHYAGGKLQLARQAFDKSNYNDVITLCDEVIKIYPPMQKQAMDLKASAVFRQQGDERRVQMSAETVNPNLVNDEKKIAAEIEKARTLIRHGKYDQARIRIEAVYKLNPFNAEAAHLANLIYSKYYTQGYYRHRADTQGMMAYEAWQWAEPVFYYQPLPQDVPDAEIKGVSDHETEAKLNSIVFPNVSLEETDITGVIEYLRGNRRHDPKGEGVIIDFESPTTHNTAAATAARPAGSAAAAAPTDDLSGAEPAAAPAPAAGPAPGAAPAAAPAAAAGGQQQRSEVAIPLVTLHVRNVTLRELLDYICFLTNLKYSVLNKRVVIGSGVKIERDRFPIRPETAGFIFRTVSGSGAGAGADAPAEPAAPSGGDSGGEGIGENIVAGVLKDVDLPPEKLKEFFQAYGIDFDSPQAAISYSSTFGTISISNTEPNLKRMRDVLKVIDAQKPMIQIELKSIEVSDSDLKELGFVWSFGAYSKSSNGSTIQAWQGDNAKGILNNLRTSLVQSEGVTPGALLENFNIFPNLTGSFKPFGSDINFDLSLTINALDRSDRAETVSAPSITVSDRVPASAFLGRSYYFPDDWEELEIEVENSDGDNSVPIFTITTPTPSFSDAEKIGTEFTVTASLKKGRIINLHLHPKFTSYIGDDSYPLKLHMMVRQDDNTYIDTVKEYRIWKPVISNRELDLNLDVRDGETVVIGALSDSNIATRRDKVPILGDLPLIGRLFQTSSERAIHKSMLFFVTARLVDGRGVPVHAVDGSGGIPELRR